MMTAPVPEGYPDPVLVAWSVAETGWPVIPLWKETRQPIGAGGEHHRGIWLTSGQAVLARAEAHHDQYGHWPSWGVVCGEPNRVGQHLVVLDPDTPEADERLRFEIRRTGAQEWQATTMQVKTNRGRHLYGTTTMPVRKCHPWPTMDLQGVGTYVVLPASSHPKGGRYTDVSGKRTANGDVWHAEGKWTTPLPIPTALLDALIPVAEDKATPPPDDGPPTSQSLDAWQEVIDAAKALGRKVVVSHPGQALVSCPGPTHKNGDRNPSLSVTAKGGRVMLYCHSGCDYADVMHALGLAPEGVEFIDAPLDEGGDTTYVDLDSELAEGYVPPPPDPEFLHRSDGYALFYKGAINRLFGDTESGKSWVMLAAVVEVLNDGGKAAVIDADAMGWRRIVRRLVLMGVGMDVLRDPERFRIVVPTDLPHLLRSFHETASWVPDFIGLDAFSGVLALMRKARNNPDDVAEAMMGLRPLTDTGACVVLIDHLAQSQESRRFGPSGSLEKGREIRGVSLRVTVCSPYAPGKGGSSKLHVEKDTDGGVRENLPETTKKGEPLAGVFRLAPQGEDPLAPGSLLWAVDIPTGDMSVTDIELENTRLDGASYEERVYKALVKANTWLSTTLVREASKVGQNVMTPTLAALLKDGRVESRAGARGAREWRAVTPTPTSTSRGE